MREHSRRGSRERGSIMMIMTFAVPLFMIPLVGLAIDATVLRITQAKLNAAVDGAVLGTGRLLGSAANPQELATEFVTANFQQSTAGFWGAYNFTPLVTYTPGTTKIVNISATANVPLLFMRMLGKSNSLVSAVATATRRDSRIEMVIDRSGSMNTSDGNGSTVIADLIAYAQGFTQSFTEGTDELGLVVYDGSAVVGYPTTRPWDPTTTSTSTGGPDTSFYSCGTSTCATGTTDMVHEIGAIQAGGYTGMAEALWLAYVELQKAHMRDMAANGGIDDRMNSIVLFTDGYPTAVTVHLNSPLDNSIVSTSACTYKTDPTNAHPIVGWVGIGGPPFNATANTHKAFAGLFGLASSDATQTAAWWMGHSYIPNGNSSENTAQDPGPPVPNTEGGCNGMYSDSNGYGPPPTYTGNDYNFTTSSKTDLRQVPNYDAWGNSLDGTAYTNSYIMTPTGNTTSPYTGSTLDHTKMTTAIDWAQAAWNATDAAANNIRNDSNLANRASDTQNMKPTIYTIGYEGDAGGTDQGLLLRLANDKSSSSYNSSQSTGIYVPASDTTALAAAFQTIASAILRLSK